MLLKFPPEISERVRRIMCGSFRKQALQLLNVSIKRAVEMWCLQFQWRNLNGCKLPGKPLYLFVPLVWLSMSLISWEEAVRGGCCLTRPYIRNPPQPLAPPTLKHTQPRSPIWLCVDVRVEGLPLPCCLTDYQVHFNYCRSIHFWLQKGVWGKLDRLWVWPWLQSNGLTLICISSFTSGMGPFSISTAHSPLHGRTFTRASEGTFFERLLL